MAKVLIIADPVLGCIPEDTYAVLKEAGVDCRLVELSEFKAVATTTNDVRVAVIGVGVKFDAALMDAIPTLSAIVSAVVGVDAIDLAAAAERKIAVANSPAEQASESLAEATILLILACLYDLPFSQELLRTGRPRPPRPSGRMLKGRSVGLVGFGRAAQGVAKRLKNWDVDVYAYARGTPSAFDGVQFLSLDSLLATCDVVSVHAALNADSRNLLNSERLGKMKHGAVLINTARGGIVDEIALAERCRLGFISAIGFDVFETEPLPQESALLSLPRSILTPHRLGHTVESFSELSQLAASNALDALEGRPLRNAVPSA